MALQQTRGRLVFLTSIIPCVRFLAGHGSLTIAALDLVISRENIIQPALYKTLK